MISNYCARVAPALAVRLHRQHKLLYTELLMRYRTNRARLAAEPHVLMPRARLLVCYRPLASRILPTARDAAD